MKISIFFILLIRFTPYSRIYHSIVTLFNFNFESSHNYFQSLIALLRNCFLDNRLRYLTFVIPNSEKTNEYWFEKLVENDLLAAKPFHKTRPLNCYFLLRADILLPWE